MYSYVYNNKQTLLVSYKLYVHCSTKPVREKFGLCRYEHLGSDYRFMCNSKFGLYRYLCNPNF